MLFALALACQLSAQPPSRWQPASDLSSIRWSVTPGDTHADHVEMSGLQLSAIVHYGVKEGKWQQRVQLVFPMLRTLPNDTHASLMHEIDVSGLPSLRINGKDVGCEVTSFAFDGMLTTHLTTGEGLRIQRQSFPSTTRPVFMDLITVVNTTDQSYTVEVPSLSYRDTTPADRGLQGAYVIEADCRDPGQRALPPGRSFQYSMIYSARPVQEPARIWSPAYEKEKRLDLIWQTRSDLVLDTPDDVMDQMFAFAKLRAVESIYDTRGGLMHGPGGGRYYAAIWANDQAEYANPFFPLLGNPEGIESAINSFRHFARYMNEDFRPIPSSIIAEGTDYWNGAGDRGDMAMIAYGASRFALAYGDEQTARELWPLISWCLEYCRRKINVDGVVASDCDELENRFPAGDANLHTSCLYYDALLSAEMLGRDLHIEEDITRRYHTEALAIHRAIESHFGAQVQGYDTYRYFAGNEVLRAWICTPLTVGILDRAQGTIEALFSKDLWTDDGLATEAGKPTFWDRATLYALRGVLAAGETTRALPFLEYYSRRRLLGEHVPYAVEAWPEGNQRHLSAESALYCRVITEGLWGIRPEGLHAFSCTPRLPEGWNEMQLSRIHLMGQIYDLRVVRKAGRIEIQVKENGVVILDEPYREGTAVRINRGGN